MYFSTPFALLSLLGLASASPVPSPSPAEGSTSPAGCSDTSFGAFAWTAKNFDFHASYIFTTPSHQNSWGYVSFDLLNPADQSTTHCEGASNQLSDFFYGTVAYKCNDTARIGETSFDFARPTNQLRVNQTWTCDDKDPKWPTTFTGRGQVDLTLECEDEKWENKEWEMGQIYSSRTITCAPVESTFKPTELTAVA
ncbi:uncharacterized protein B0H64DRAFT_121216 [Chaetomium fimeti]|uniref:AA1-like domain-containing protein n=1 Tax=Chaetomium fimeti TaxID=1854472 RepID=A0AAE0HKD5_9PEZI|nr:hypothetical protein B0H64DRAFT_121216 [Chaetomium fimeti]